MVSCFVIVILFALYFFKEKENDKNFLKPKIYTFYDFLKI